MVFLPVILLLWNLVPSLHVLITGGTGFIGSHTAVALIQAGHKVTIMDNLSNSKITVLDKIQKITGVRPDFYNVDCQDRNQIGPIFRRAHFDAVVHMAGFKAVGESVKKPLKYYQNNLQTTLAILFEMKDNDVNKFIFSSSATVYGKDAIPGYVETMPAGRGLTNPYTKTKYFIEQILQDYAVSNPKFQVSLLRYFNPIGAHKSGLLGDDPSSPPTNLMPVIMQVAAGKIPQLEIFGNDYPTPDGTCLRDYIHVVDLAEGHVAALDHLKPGTSIYNLGTGHGTSVLELVAVFEKVNKRPLPKRIVGRRAGDLPVIYANVSKAARELNWRTKLTIEDAMKDTVTFLKHQRQEEKGKGLNPQATYLDQESESKTMIFVFMALIALFIGGGYFLLSKKKPVKSKAAKE